MKFDEQCGAVVPVGSHPSRGAWIEIETRSASGYRPVVAPLTGCVD